jgi:hypothetical protein
VAALELLLLSFTRGNDNLIIIFFEIIGFFRIILEIIAHIGTRDDIICLLDNDDATV